MAGLFLINTLSGAGGDKWCKKDDPHQTSIRFILFLCLLTEQYIIGATIYLLTRL